MYQVCINSRPKRSWPEAEALLSQILMEQINIILVLYRQKNHRKMSCEHNSSIPIFDLSPSFHPKVLCMQLQCACCLFQSVDKSHYHLSNYSLRQPFFLFAYVNYEFIYDRHQEVALGEIFLSPMLNLQELTNVGPKTRRVGPTGAHPEEVLHPKSQPKR